eukprot:323718_1
MGNVSSSDQMRMPPICYSDTHSIYEDSTATTNDYKCKYHSQTRFDRIQISPICHSLILDGYIRTQCSSLYILPSDVSMLCQTMLWGYSYHTITVNEDELSTITSPKQMSTNG